MSTGVSFTDPKTGKDRKMAVPVPFVAKGLPVVLTNVNAEPPIATGSKGPLDFGRGNLLTLRELIVKADNAFKVRYRYDGRLAQSLYFVNGKYERETFEKALAKVTVVPPIQAPGDPDAQVNSNIDQLLNGVLKDLGNQFKENTGLRGDLAFGRASGTLSDLIDSSSWARNTFGAMELDPSTQARYFPVLQISVDAGTPRTAAAPDGSQSVTIANATIYEIR